MKINKIALIPFKKSDPYVSGWILPSGEIVRIPMYEHANYVMNNPLKFNINEDIDGELTAYLLAFRNEAIRFSYSKKLSLDGSSQAISKLIGPIHSLYKTNGNNNGICVSLRMPDGHPMKEVDLSNFEELYQYASKSLTNWYKTSIKKFKLTKEDKGRIEKFVEKIKKGYVSWIDEDVQLYQNNVEIIEKMLKGEKINWINVVEDEFEKSLRELEELMRK